MSGKMFSWGSLLTALLLCSAVHAEGKRFLVQFKAPSTFQNVARNISSSRMAAPSVVAPMRLFGSGPVVAEALEHIEMLVIESSDPRSVQSLKQHPAVALVEEEIFHPSPEVMATRGGNPGANILHRMGFQLDRPWGIDAVKAPNAWNVNRGSGVRVMVLDTGLDTGHPALSSRFEKGQNFTGGDRADISDQVGHGTHVSGTILADGRRGGLVGVAPEASLLMGKVCSDRGCSSVAIAMALDWAVSEKADVVNMSLGGFFISDAEARALARAEQAGVMVIAASGNDGTKRVSYPAAVGTVLAVGAVDPSLKKADFSQWGPELAVVAPGVEVLSAVPRGTGRASVVRLSTGEAKSLPFVGSPAVTLPDTEMVFGGFGRPDDYSGVSVTGKIVLISRGEIPFKDKVANAIAQGAVGVIVYNNAPGLVQATVTLDGSEVAIPGAMIEQTVGEALKAQLSANQKPSASLAVQRTDYASFQGTSMATPHVAGVAALVRAANRKLTPAEVREVLKVTATALGPNDENQYGRGIVNADAAVTRAAAMTSNDVRQAAN